jgi:hypothetical protein
MSKTDLPPNPHWDTVDYTQLTNRAVYRILIHEYPGEKAIRKILQTVKAPHVILEAARHPNAHILDIAEAVQKAIANGKLTAPYVTRMSNMLYVKKRPELNEYFLKEHNLDISDMPRDMLKDLLGI